MRASAPPRLLPVAINQPACAVAFEAGLQTVGWLHSDINDEKAAEAAAARQVEGIPLSWYERGRPKLNGLQLGFAATNPPEIRRGVRELAIALEAAVKKEPGARIQEPGGGSR